MPEAQTDCEILIVGAGPAGLTLANELLRWGTPFRIVDRKPEPERHSKACNLWPRSQEVFAAIGVLERLRERSAPLHTFSLHGYGALLGHIRIDRRPSPHGTPAFIGQNVIEQVLSGRLDEAGAPVERQVVVVEVADRGDHAGRDADPSHRHRAASAGSRLPASDRRGAHVRTGTVARDVVRRRRMNSPVAGVMARRCRPVVTSRSDQGRRP